MLLFTYFYVLSIVVFLVEMLIIYNLFFRISNNCFIIFPTIATIKIKHHTQFYKLECDASGGVKSNGKNSNHIHTAVTEKSNANENINSTKTSAKNTSATTTAAMSTEVQGIGKNNGSTSNLNLNLNSNLMSQNKSVAANYDEHKSGDDDINTNHNVNVNTIANENSENASTKDNDDNNACKESEIKQQLAQLNAELAQSKQVRKYIIYNMYITVGYTLLLC